MKHIVFLADPAQKLKPKGDSTLSLVRAALRGGWKVSWALDEGVEFRGDRLGLWSQTCVRCDVDGLPELRDWAFLWADELDALAIRKDPPFDAGYLQLCWMLALVEPHLFMLNRPSLLARYHEKLVPLEAVAQGFLLADDIIPTHIGRRDTARDFVEAHGLKKILTKPFLGYGGNGVELQTREAFMATKGSEREDILIQPFLEEIYDRGDRRVFFLDGELLGHFVRLPKAGGFISNLAQGGTAVARPLDAAEKKVLQRLGKFLKAAGIHLAGADLIGSKVSEVNITSPTGLRSLEALDAHDYADDIMAFVGRNTASGKR
jgi:glutathione synthase